MSTPSLDLDQAHVDPESDYSQSKPNSEPDQVVSPQSEVNGGLNQGGCSQSKSNATPDQTISLQSESKRTLEQAHSQRKSHCVADHVGSTPQQSVLPRDLPREERFQLARRGPTLIFDGVCNLCNASMRWYYERLLEDSAIYFMWAQHEDTQQLLSDFGIGSDIYKSWAYIQDEVVYRGSSAWFQAMVHLCAPWRWLGSFRAVPSILREGAYGVVSSNRYSLLGKSSVCQRPAPGMMELFLHDIAASAVEETSDAEATKRAKHTTNAKQLLVVGCGPAGIQIVRKLAKEFSITVVEPKDYFEFTPGILRGLCDLEHLKSLQVPLADAFAGLPVQHLRGQVVGLREKAADVWLSGPDPENIVEVSFDYVVVASGSQYAGTSLWKITGAPGEEAETCLDGRVSGITNMRQRLFDLRSRDGCAILVGAGLVGVELAAELAHYIPGLRIVLADLAPTVLPPLPASAQKYATDWLIRNGVELRLGKPLPRGSDAEIAAALEIEGESMVLGCAGVAMRSSFMAPLGCLDDRGSIRVNAAMQVLTSNPSQEDVASLGIERAAVCGAGRIFALGDCVSVDGATYTKDIYPAEAMSDVIVANLRLAKTVQCLRTCPGILHELRSTLQQMTLCSLGPDDCIFVMNGYTVATGWIATNMKDQIEKTKMGQLRNRIFGSLVWRFVPHF